MPLQIIRQDITRLPSILPCDAIVNAAKNTLLGGGGVDGAIHRAAGPELLEACRKLGGCKTGEAKITGAYGIEKCKHIIHTVGPMWYGGQYDEEKLLRSCYRNSLALAEENGCESVAFPLISSGIYGYPKDQALRVAVDEIGAFLMEHEMTVYLTVFSKEGYQIGSQLFANIQSYIDDRYVAEHSNPRRESARRRRVEEITAANLPEDGGIVCGFAAEDAMPAPAAAPKKAARFKGNVIGTPLTEGAGVGLSLEERLKMRDESFTQMLLRKIDEKGITDAQCYKKANIDRKLFSKIRNDPDYKPKKATALAFAIALELPMQETKELLMKAGFALSNSSKFDIIVQFFIEQGNYNIFEINNCLFAEDQELLGQ